MRDNTDIAAIESHLHKQLPFYLDMLKQMVDINSFTANPEGVNALGARTASFFSTGLGFQARGRPAANPLYGEHLILERPGKGRHTVGLVSHLDTVFPATEERENDFRWRRQGDRLYGPGTVDIKGGTVVIYMILDALRRFEPNLFTDTNWVVLLDAAEEADGQDFARLCLERMSPEHTLACLVFEGGRIRGKQAQVVTSRKGMAVFHVTVEGRAAHAGSAHAEGANAVVQMARVIDEVAGMTDYRRLLTINVGTVAGGTVVNRVPHHASATVEMRAFDPEVFEEGLEQVLALPGRASVHSAANGFRCQIQVDVTRRMRPWPINPATERLFDVWKAAGEKLGIRVAPEARGGLSDGNYLWDALPTLDGLGPAGGNAHCSERSQDGTKDQEYVRRSSFVPKALLNTVAILTLLQEAREAGSDADHPRRR